MSSSQYMDKQNMELSGSENSDFFELINPTEEQNVGKKEEILPSYDFHPIRPVGSVSLEGSSVAGSRALNSADSKSNASGFTNYASLEPHEAAKVTLAEDSSAYDTATVSEIDQTMKKHADNMLHALDGVSARLSQLETRTRTLESSVDDLKVSIGNNHGSNDGRLRQLENMLREVQTGVQFLRDKQEIAEAQMQLVKLHAKGDQPTENPNTAQTDSTQLVVSPPQQPLPPQVALTQPSPLPALPPPNAPQPHPQLNLPPVQLHAQLPQSQMPHIPPLPQEQYFPPSGQLPDVTHQQYQMPAQQPDVTHQQYQMPAQQPDVTHQQYQMPTQQPHPPPSHQNYQTPSQFPHYSQPSQLAPQQPQPLGPVNPPPPHLQPPLSHHSEENPYMPPPQSYPPSIRQPGPLSQPPSGPTPSQPFYGPTNHMYEPSGIRPSSGQSPFSAGYGSPPGPNYNDSYPYSGSPSHYGNSAMKQSQHSSPAPPSGSGYSRLPTAQILPQAIPTSGSNSGGTENRAPIDDVVDKVTTMGFSREQVRATVRRLTENGQSVDLNVVLDKLMNDGEVIQPQKGWFGR
ncbi:uncharacterized protein LOC143884506 isoform X2 [Tasmannia lanceolata]|uniref:uncharacterized protein LOC143884506 isoform X2 n=1 Tax=Tasmannia lanceolata TaxID=3420 RepID=UPI004063B1F6